MRAMLFGILAAGLLWCAAGAATAQTRPASVAHEPADVKEKLDQGFARQDLSKTIQKTGIYLLAMVVGLLVAAKVLPRLLGPARQLSRGRVIEVVETHRLEPRKTIYLVRVGDQHLLVGSTADRLETLAGGPLDQAQLAAALKRYESPPDDPSASNGARKRRFLDLLKAK